LNIDNLTAGRKDASPVSRRGMDWSNHEPTKASPSFSKNAEAPGIAALVVHGWAQSHVHTDQSHFEKGQFLEPMKFTPKGWNWEK